ncbi:MAG: hypothetical protein AABZ60_01020 [Planctomycetota bacterium]
MGIVTALKFTPEMGAICVDQESWYLNRRRTLFNDILYPLNLPQFTQEFQINWVYGAVGNPNFHMEVIQKARKEIETKWKKGHFQNTVEIMTLSRIILKAFQQTWRRRIDDQIRFLYGFGADDLNRGYFLDSKGQKIPIKNSKIKQYALDCVNQKEKLFFGTLPTPNHICLIGVDPNQKFSAFCIKEDQGVLSFQSGGFESLGDGCYAGAMEMARTLNLQFLSDRRQGCGRNRGVLTLLSSILEASDHYAKIGGNIRMMILDAQQPQEIKELRDAPARIALEITKSYRAQILSQEQAEQMLADLIFHQNNWEAMEAQLFQTVSSRTALDKLLRGYKNIGELPTLPENHPFFGKEKQL